MGRPSGWMIIRVRVRLMVAMPSALVTSVVVWETVKSTSPRHTRERHSRSCRPCLGAL
jgi:hypothetical protein